MYINIFDRSQAHKRNNLLRKNLDFICLKHYKSNKSYNGAKYER